MARYPTGHMVAIASTARPCTAAPAPLTARCLDLGMGVAPVGWRESLAGAGLVTADSVTTRPASSSRTHLPMIDCRGFCA